MVVAAADQHLPSQIDHIFVFYQAAFKPAFCNPSIGHGGIIPRLSLRWEMNIRDTINFFVLTDTGTTRTPGRERTEASSVLGCQLHHLSFNCFSPLEPNTEMVI